MQKAITMGLILPRTAGDSPSHHRGLEKKKHPRPSGWHNAFQSTSARMSEALILEDFGSFFATSRLTSSQWGEPFDGICRHTIHSIIHALITTDTVLARKRWFQRFTSFLCRKHMKWLATLLRLAWPKVDSITINQAAVTASIHRVPPSPEACTAPGGPSNRIQRSQAPTNDSQKDKTLGLVRRREHPSISGKKNSFSNAFAAQALSFSICIYPHLHACLWW